MAQFDMSKPVLNYVGEPVKVNGVDFNFREAFLQALGMMTPQEQGQGQGAETKSKIFALSNKLFRGNTVSLTVDEAALLKERCGFISTPLTYGRVCEFLEGQEPEFTPAGETDTSTTETATTTTTETPAE